MDNIVGNLMSDLPAIDFAHIDFAAFDLDDAEDFKLSKAQEKA